MHFLVFILQVQVISLNRYLLAIYIIFVIRKVKHTIHFVSLQRSEPKFAYHSGDVRSRITGGVYFTFV